MRESVNDLKTNLLFFLFSAHFGLSTAGLLDLGFNLSKKGPLIKMGKITKIKRLLLQSSPFCRISGDYELFKP